MRPTTWLPALCALMLCACSTTPPHAPAVIPPPPVALISRCPPPTDLPPDATAQNLGEWVMQWIGAYGCERSKRAALIDSWPR